MQINGTFLSVGICHVRAGNALDQISPNLAAFMPVRGFHKIEPPLVGWNPGDSETRRLGKFTDDGVVSNAGS